jgi:hypothetical protein
MAHFDHEVDRVRLTRSRAGEIPVRPGRFITRDEAEPICFKDTGKGAFHWLISFH